MKIFVFSKDTLLIYGLVVLVLVGMFTVGTMSETVITNATTGSNLPVYSVKTEKKQIAITFDCAWEDTETNGIMQVLKDNNAKSSFFVVGGYADRYPESLKKLCQEGHEVLNHTDTHLHMSKLSKEQIIKEITVCEDKINSITGQSLKIFRPPYGDYNNTLITVAKEQGFLPVQWDVDSNDWKDTDPSKIASEVAGNIKNGSIVLFHNGAKNTVEALKILLPQLKNEGYEFVPVSQLVYREGYVIDKSGMQSKI